MSKIRPAIRSVWPSNPKAKFSSRGSIVESYKIGDTQDVARTSSSLPDASPHRASSKQSLNLKVIFRKTGNGSLSHETSLPHRWEDEIVDIPQYNQFILDDLQRIPGVGPTRAKRLMDHGCKGVSDLRSSPQLQQLLPPKSLASLNFVDTLELSVTRNVAELLLDVLKRDVLGSEWEAVLAGAYRRGVEKMRAIELLLFRNDFSQELSLPSMERIIRTGNIPVPTVDSLSSVLDSLKSNGIIAKTFLFERFCWQGIVRIPLFSESPSERRAAIAQDSGDFRRMQIELGSYRNRGAVLLDRTGDAEFVSHCRKAAEAKGMLLDEHTLWQLSGGDGAFMGQWKPMSIGTEEELLTKIGLEYTTPHQRNFSNLLRRRKPK